MQFGAASNWRYQQAMVCGYLWYIEHGRERTSKCAKIQVGVSTFHLMLPKYAVSSERPGPARTHY